jgi:hypothetical protein
MVLPGSFSIADAAVNSKPPAALTAAQPMLVSGPPWNAQSRLGQAAHAAGAKIGEQPPGNRVSRAFGESKFPGPPVIAGKTVSCEPLRSAANGVCRAGRRC